MNDHKILADFIKDYWSGIFWNLLLKKRNKINSLYSTKQHRNVINGYNSILGYENGQETTDNKINELLRA
jgi:hypothetical protein